MSTALNSSTQIGVSQPSEYSKALTLKRKIDVAIREKELQQMSHNIRAIAEGKESKKTFATDVVRKGFAGSIAGAMVGGVAAVPLTILKQPFRSLRHKSLGMAAVAGGTVLGGLGFGAKRLKEGRKQIYPRRSNPELNQLRRIRQDLKNPETPVYKSMVTKGPNIKLAAKRKKIVSDITDVASAGALAGASGSILAGGYSLKKSPLSDPYYTPHLSETAKYQ